MKKLAFVIALAAGGCTAHTPGSAHTMRITDQGGVIRLAGGDLDEAALAAVRTIKTECGGDRFTVTAIEDAGPYIPDWRSDNHMDVVPAVWSNLSYQCGGVPSSSQLTVRVLSWAERAQAAETARLAAVEAQRREDAPYKPDAWGQCDQGGIKIDGLCVR